MAGRVDANRLINKLQRSMALKESGAERPFNSGKRYVGCDGHGCNAACGYHGYCDFEATRYYHTRKGQTEGRNRKSERHDYYKRGMRLGYDSSDY